MTTRNNGLPKPRLPSPGEILSPIVGIENSVISAVQAPFASLGLPTLPRIQGPVALVNSVISQIPAPPQLPRLPSIPELPRLN